MKQIYNLNDVLEIEIHCKNCTEIVQVAKRDNIDSPWNYTMPELDWCPKCGKSLK